MWLLLAMWLVRGGTMSDTRPAPTDLPTTVMPVIDPRTKADVEADMTRVARQLIHHRSRQGDTKNRLEIRDQQPALLTQELAWLQDEWAAFNDASSLR